MPCIHGWQSSLVLKNIPCLSETIPSPSPYITFIFPFWLHPQRQRPCRPIVVSTFSGLRYPFDLHMSVHSYSGDWRTLSHVPWFIILKLLVHGLYTFQILISLKWRHWRRFNWGNKKREIKRELKSGEFACHNGRRWAYLLFCYWNSIWLQCRNDVFYTLAGVGRKRLPTHAMWIFIRKVEL